MRLELYLNIKNRQLQKDYHKLFSGILKREIFTYEKEVHDKVFQKNGKIGIPFTFSLLLPRGSKFEADKIKLEDGKVRLTFSTSNEELFVSMLNSLKNIVGKTIVFKQILEQEIEFKKVEIVKLPQQKETELRKYQILSPVIIREVGARFKETFHVICDNNNEWLDVLTDNLYERLDLVADDILDSDFNIVIDKVSKTVVSFQKHKMNATLGTIIIDATPELHAYLYANGLGDRCESGFGMLKYIESIEG